MSSGEGFNHHQSTLLPTQVSSSVFEGSTSQVFLCDPPSVQQVKKTSVLEQHVGEEPDSAFKEGGGLTFSCFLLPEQRCSRGRCGGENFSIAEAVRQRTGEKRNKSASSRVSGDHPRQGSGAERQSGRGGEFQHRSNVLLLYFPGSPAPMCHLNLPPLI